MNSSADDAVHCETYALGRNFGCEHVGVCECCTRLAALFNLSFASFINEIMPKQLNDDQLRHGINKMINSLLRLTLMVKHYTYHRVLSMVQFDMINKIMN